MNLVIANPPTSRRRKRRAKARIRQTLRAARARRRAARKSSGAVIMKKRSTRRRRGSASSRGFSLVPSRDTLTTAAAATGGFLAANWLANQQFVPASMRVGWGRIGAKAALTIGAAALARRISPRASTGILLGGLISVGLDVVNRAALASSGVSGLAGRMETSPSLQQLRGMEDQPSDPYGLAGRIETSYVV